MKFEMEKIYNVYNRGNNKQKIFFTAENYMFFLRKVRKLLLPNCEILSYCLMPNHFHFLIYANERTVAVNDENRNLFSESIRQLLSQYTKAINNQENRTSSLFQQNTKAKEMRYLSCHDYRGTIKLESALTCFNYIHKNPSAITNNLLLWKYSSYLDYAGFRNGTLCNKKLAYELFGINANEFMRLF